MWQYPRMLVYYAVFDPHPGFIEDDGGPPESVQEIRISGTRYLLSLHFDAKGEPWFARIGMPHLTTHTFPREDQRAIAFIKEHLRTVLTLSWKPDVRYLRVDVLALREEGKALRQHFARVPMTSVDRNEVHGMFGASLEIRHELALFAEAHDDHIPLHYRYLSLYKLFESRYPMAVDQETALREYESIRDEWKLRKGLRQELQDVRDRCAHAISSKRAAKLHPNNRKVSGISALRFGDQDRVKMMLSVLVFVCQGIINELAAGKFKIAGDPIWKIAAGNAMVPKSGTPRGNGTAGG